MCANLDVKFLLHSSVTYLLNIKNCLKNCFYSLFLENTYLTFMGIKKSLNSFIFIAL